MRLLVVNAQADLRAGMSFVGSRIRDRRRAVFPTVDAHPDAAIALLAGSNVHIISDTVESESLAARPTWIGVGHFRRFDRERIRHRFDWPCSRRNYI